MTKKTALASAPSSTWWWFGGVWFGGVVGGLLGSNRRRVGEELDHKTPRSPPDTQSQYPYAPQQDSILHDSLRTGHIYLQKYPYLRPPCVVVKCVGGESRVRCRVLRACIMVLSDGDGWIGGPLNSTIPVHKADRSHHQQHQQRAHAPGCGVAVMRWGH